jgi:hypothetical protein
VINGGLECPAYAGGWHHTAVKLRINRYCHAAALLDLAELGSMSGCKKMDESLEECLGDGMCPFCEQFIDGEYHAIVDDDDSVAGNGTVASGGNKTAITESDESSGIETAIIESDENVDNEMSEPTNPPSVAGESISISPSAAANSTSSASPTSVGNDTGTSGTPTISLANGTLPSSPTTAGIESNTTSDPPTAAASESTGHATTESIGDGTAEGANETDVSVEENTFPTWSPTAMETTPPSYSPTTPAPTFGPCDGDPCPNMLCRSTWGFCGEGEGYCNDKAIWSPDCPAKPGSATEAPSPAGSSSVTGNATFAVYDSEPSETKSPTPSESETVSKFEKPSGGKKPPPNKKPGLSSSETSSDKEEAVTDAETLLPSPAPAAVTTSPTEQSASEAPTPVPVLSPDDPAATYFCGIDWIDANKVCEIRCPSAKSEDCPEDQSCYAFTKCNDPPTPAPSVANVIAEVSDMTEEGGNTTTSHVASPSPADPSSSSPNATGAASSSPGDPKDEAAADSGCTGKPCEIAGECRSQFGFCGGSFIYCNDLSSWSMDACGLFGTDANGETLLCDAEVQECSTGESVIRNPDNNCEFFSCPTEGEGEGSTFSAFNVPATSPSLPELPKPTLPTIIDPMKPDFNSLDLALEGSNKGNQTIDLGSAEDEGKVVIIGDKDEVADDKDEAPEGTNTPSSETESANPYGLTNYESFSYEDWKNGVIGTNAHWLAYLGMTLIIALTI